MHCRANALAGGAGLKNFNRCTRDRQIVDKAAAGWVVAVQPQTRDAAIQHGGCFWRKTCGGGCFASDEAVGRVESSGAEGGFAVVNFGDHHIHGPFELWAREADASGRAALANPKSIGLGELVVALRADGHPLDRADDLIAGGVFGSIQAFEEGARARELVAFAKTWDGPNAMVGRAAQNRMADLLCAAAVLDVIANRVAAA